VTQARRPANVPSPSHPSPSSPAVADSHTELNLALDRAAGTRPIGGNEVEHLPDSAATLEEMLRLIAGAKHRVHLENYIIRSDRTGKRFAEALSERASAGVRVRVLFDAFGSIGTAPSYWRGLARTGVEVRAFHPLISSRLFNVFTRDHRKLLAVDGHRVVMGGLCIGDEWAGDETRGRHPWRDTMVGVHGPAAAAFERSFARVWARAGEPLPPDELGGSPEPGGRVPVRVLAGIPGQARCYRAVQLLAAVAAHRLWITDAYMVAPALLFASLLDAARNGVDVRLLVPGTSDVPVVRTFTRAGYRELLAAGVRIFEWRGPMLHAKTMVADRAWVRVGSSNLNVPSLLTNYELDMLIEDTALADEFAAQFVRDLAISREIVLRPRRRLGRPALVGSLANPSPLVTRHRRSGYELGTAAVVAFGRVAVGARRAVIGSAALTLTTTGVLLVLFPRVMSIILAACAFGVAVLFALYGRRGVRETDGDGG
jgi:cardiolipin synthase